MSNHFNKLTPPELERLAVLSEECSEVIQVINKIIRHGYESYWPNPEDTNRKRLEQELGDLHLAMALLHSHNDVDMERVEAKSLEKIPKLAKWLHHNELKNLLRIVK